MSDRDLKHLHADMKVLCEKFLSICDIHFHGTGIRVFVDETYRNPEQQYNDYAKGRAAPGAIITNAKYGQSPHNTTLEDGTPAAVAFDFAIQGPDGKLDWNIEDQAWHDTIAIGQGLGLVSGEHFPNVDGPHFELPNWKRYNNN